MDNIELKKEKKRIYNKRYIDKMGTENYNKLMLEFYYKNKSKGYIRARDRNNPNYKPRIKINIE